MVGAAGCGRRGCRSCGRGQQPKVVTYRTEVDTGTGMEDGRRTQFQNTMGDYAHHGKSENNISSEFIDTTGEP